LSVPRELDAQPGLAYDELAPAFESGDYDALLGPLMATIPDPLMWLSTPHETVNPDQLKLIREASKAPTVARRLELLAKADRQAVEMAVRIPLVYRYTYYLRRPWVTGVVFTLGYDLRLNPGIVMPH